MPYTRRSSTSTGSAVPAPGSAELSGAVAGGKQRSKGTAGTEGHNGNKESDSSQKKVLHHVRLP